MIKVVKIFKKIGGALLFFILGIISFTFFLFIYYAKDLPRPELFSEREITQSTKIYDRTGEILLYEIYSEEKRTYVPLEKIPEHLKKAVIAAEDSNFYNHFGVDFKGITRAILEDLKIGKPLYGGSTIPQQLIRSTFLTPEKTIARKTKEVILAIELDLKYSKDQILEWYLNQVPFGENAYGVEAASKNYFGKSVSEISLGEAAILAALIKAPYKLSPYDEKGKEELFKRKNYILERMEKLGFISKKELEKAKEEKIFLKEKKSEFFAPYFILWIKKLLKEKYGNEFLMRKGLKVYTSLDVEFQKIAQEVVKQGIERNKNFLAYNSCLVAIDPRNGEVLAMTVGTGNYYEDPFPENCTPGKDCKFDPKVNVCFSLRQPGSAFKPFIYAEAFKKGYDDKFLVLDEFTNFGLWGNKEYTPKNYDGKFRGLVSLREALAQSLNIPSIKVLYLVGRDKKLEKLEINNFKGKESIFLKGLEKSLKLVRELGITTLNKPLSFYGPSIVLGGGEVSLFELTLAYGAFANGGFKVKANPIIKIEDSEGNIIYRAKKSQIRVIEKKVVDLITDILSDNKARIPMFGEKSYLYFKNYKVAAKTGTTQNFKDGWTLGYVPSLVVGVWVGNNDGSSMLKQPGVIVAGPIWHNFLEKVLPKIKPNSF